MAFNTKIILTNDKVCQPDGGILTLCGDTSIDALGTFKYTTDQSGSYTVRSVVDRGYVTGLTSGLNTRVTTIENKYLSGATNGIGFTGKEVCLGGALVANTTIGGAYTMGFNNTIINLTGTSGININAPAGALKLVTQPSTGGVSDFILVRSSDGIVKQVAGTSLGAITGATNGLTKSGQQVKLGGTLTGDTTIATNDNALIISSGATSLFKVDGLNGWASLGDFDNIGLTYVVSDAVSKYNEMYSDDGVINYADIGQTVSSVCVEVGGGNTCSYIFVCECGVDIINDKNSTSICLATGGTFIDGGVGFKGAQYCGDYSSDYTLRSLVDVAYVTGKTSQAILTASNGLTKTGTNVTLGGTLTGNTSIYTNIHTFEIYNGGGAGLIHLFSCNAGLRISADTVCIGYPSQSSILFDQCCTTATSGIDGGGIKYASNYATGFTNRSLVDKEYVDGAAGGISASNGLTRVDNNITLGGQLTGDTIVDVNFHTFLVCGAPNNKFIEITEPSLGQGKILIHSESGATLSSASDVLITAPTVAMIGAATLNVDFNSIVFSNTTNTTGAIYNATYAPNFRSSYLCNSLVDAAYVTGLTSQGILTASNGLTKTGQNVTLGGALTGDTTISACKLCVTSGLYGSNVGYLTFSGATTVPTTAGSLYYANNVLNLQREFAGVVLQVGEESVVKVCNTGGSPIPNGTAVYISGVNGGLPVVSASIASNKAQSFGTIGLTTMTIGATSQGYVAMLGVVHDLNTNAYTVGTILYLSSSVAGTLTSTIPAYPNETIKLGTVTVQSATIGEVLIDVHNLTEYVTNGQFTGYTATTASNLNLKLDKVTFNSYTGTTTPIINGLVSMCAVAITGATNGLTKPSAHLVCLGGTLTAPTTISGTQLLTLGDLNGICLSTAGTTDIALNAKSNGSIYLKSQAGTVVSSSDHTTAIGIELDYNASVPMLVYDTTVGVCKGLQYAADYSTSYSDRSLVDKAYVNSVAAGLNVHGAVVVTTTGATTLSGVQVIDGVTTTTGMRILVKDQSPAWLNGIYSANTGTWGRTPDYDFAPSGEVSNGDLIPVLSGTTYANSQWVLTSPNPITSGVTSLVYSIFSQQQGITEGNGICVTTVGANRNVAVKLSPSNAGLCFDTTALEIDYNIFRVGLTCLVTTGKVDVRATVGAVTGSEIGVRINTGGTNTLYVDSATVATCLGTPITTANNGLNKAGSNVRLGGALTGSTTISGGGLYDLSLSTLNAFNLGFNSVSTISDSGTNGGLRYAGDYSANYVARSIPDVAYVSSLVTSGVLASNGLTKSGNYVILGGVLTGNTNVNLGAGYLCFADGGTNTVALTSTCSRIQVANNMAFLSGCSGANAATVCVTNAGILSLKSTVAAGSGIVVTAPVTGAIYAANYGSTFIARSLVDAAYVTGKTSLAILTASNGLTKTGSNVTLGGTLAGITTINGAQTLRFNISTFNVTGTTNATGALNVSGAIDGNSTLDVLGATSLQNTLTVTSATTLNSTLNVSGAIDGNSTLDILGATALRGTLAVTGTTTLSAKASYLTNLAPFTALQIPDAAYVTGLTSQAILTASNGLTKTGQNVTLGGALVGNTTINGAFNLGFNNTNVNISGSTGVNITTAAAGLKLVTAPSTGSAVTDLVLVRATDGTVKTVASSSVGDKNNIYSITAVTTNVTLTTASPYVILVNGAAPVTITLPAVPVTGEAFKIKDISNAAVTNNITINRNGKNVDGAAADALINTSGGAIELVYDGSASWYTLSFVN